MGDWRQDPASKEWLITVSEASDWRHEFLIALHELVEMALCLHSNITQQQVDKFDMHYTGTGEPGYDSDSPYTAQHCVADGIERIMATLLDVKWSDYEDALNQITHEQH